MEYQPGTHIIASLKASQPDLLMEFAPVRSCIEELISNHELQKLGDVYHDFPGGGFTATVCLSESHLSLHTWPEHNLVNLDIYLSNFKRNNDGTVEKIYSVIRDFFNAEITQQQIIHR